MQQLPAGAGLQRPALRPGGGRGRAPAAPDPTAQVRSLHAARPFCPLPSGNAGTDPHLGTRTPSLQQDRHTTLGSLLLRAERGPDPTERILAVAR